MTQFTFNLNHLLILVIIVLTFWNIQKNRRIKHLKKIADKRSYRNLDLFERCIRLELSTAFLKNEISRLKTTQQNEDTSKPTEEVK